MPLDFYTNRVYIINIVRKTFKYRAYPAKKQKKTLEQTLDGCRWLYNHFLEERKERWETAQKNTSRYAQCNTLKSLKKENPFLKDIYSQVLQNVAVRIDLAFRAFFRRVKTGEKPGYPRFKGKGRYDSFTYPQSGFKISDGYLHLSKIGDIKLKYHRPIEGTIKTCTMHRTATGKWFVTFSCVLEEQAQEKPIDPAIGIDMGLESFATFSDGYKIENPRFFRHEEKQLAKAQRKLSRQGKGTKHREKARKVVARIHERINNKRKNFAHQESRKIVNTYNTICVEDLNINKMKKDNFRSMNKSIGDAAWSMFLEFLDYKAEEAGKRAIGVNPAYTSQTCSRCGNRHKLKLSDRVYHCPICSLSLDRDVNAAINILALGMQSLARPLAKA